MTTKHPPMNYYEYQCLTGTNLPKLISGLNAEALMGWELASSHSAKNYGIGGEIVHYFILKRKRRE